MDQSLNVALGGIRRKPVGLRVQPRSHALLAFGPHINLACGIAAHKDDRKARLKAVITRQASHIQTHLLAQLLGETPSIDDLGLRHRSVGSIE